MPEPAGIEWIGGERAIADMNRWAEEVGPLVAKERELADNIRSEVSGDVPYITGVLAGSVAVFDIDEDSGWGVGYDGGADAYDGWVEFGGSRGRSLVPEGRWLYPISLAHEDDFVQSVVKIAEDSVEGFAWSTPSA